MLLVTFLDGERRFLRKSRIAELNEYINCRGLGKPSAVCSLCELIRREAPALVFLAETKLSRAEFDRVRVRLGDFNRLAVDSMGRSGGATSFVEKTFT